MSHHVVSGALHKITQVQGLPSSQAVAPERPMHFPRQQSSSPQNLTISFAVFPKTAALSHAVEPQPHSNTPKL